MTEDVIELRLPPRPEHIPVIRAVIGAVAGGMNFNYDEIMQLRVAATEAFEISVRNIGKADPGAVESPLTVRFSSERDSIEILITAPRDYIGPFSRVDEAEGRAVLQSLLDELEYGTGNAEEPMFRMVKRRSNPGR